VASGALQLPEKPTVLGWYAAGAAPGEDTGTAVLAGHLDSATLGPGPLVQLFNLKVGDLLQVADAAGGIHRAGWSHSPLPARVALLVDLVTSRLRILGLGSGLGGGLRASEHGLDELVALAGEGVDAGVDSDPAVSCSGGVLAAPRSRSEDGTDRCTADSASSPKDALICMPPAGFSPAAGNTL
jgi:hypothetical protein